MSNPQSRAHRKPPDVEEALSSMLWTPYDNNISESDSSDETEALHRVNNNSSSNNSFSFFGTGPAQDHRRHQQQSLMRRSLSAWSYRNRTGKSPRSPGESDTVGNRFSYPYYDQPELGLALGGGFSGGWYDSSSITNNNNNNSNTNYYYGINGSSYGYGLPVTSSRSSYTFQPELAAAVGPAESRAPWQTLTVAGEDRAIEKRPYLQQRQYQQLQTPFVGRWQNGAGTAQLETSSLPFSLLALDSPAAAAVGGVRRSATTATDGTTLVGPGGSEVDGFADSYQDDYQHNPSITTTLLPLLAYGGGGRVGTPDAASITRTPSCNSTAEGDERLATGSGPLTCVRQANAATSTSVRRADDGFRGELDRVDQQQQNKATSPHRVPAMRLNVPAAGLAEGSRTSVYIPSTVADGVGVGGVGGSILPALTIQVNRLDPNNQQQNDVVNNAASGVSIVSCYRAASATGGPAVVQMEDCGGPEEGDAPKCIRAPGGDRDRVLGVAVPKERAEEKKRTKIDDDLVADSGGVNTSDVNLSPEQMVQVSSVEERLNVAGDVEFSTREHRRRERRERRQARNRLQHIHPLEPPGPAPGPGPNLLHRSPPPIEIIPDILHSHLPPPYTTLPMGASLIPQMIPANAVAAAAAAAAASAIPVRAADDCRYTFPIPIMRSCRPTSLVIQYRFNGSVLRLAFHPETPAPMTVTEKDDSSGN
uniref:Uncharacterized protein n=1 Tax=Anopheles farauti TaxID=69004 RepID=A0A182R0T5_9DIPT